MTTETTSAATLIAKYVEGTHRVRSPEETLSAIEPLLPQFGITRVCDITHLDRPSIPTCCALRPTARVMQVSNGKGTTLTAAKVSALMESIELFHAENSDSYPQKYQARSDFSTDETVIDHIRLPSFRSDIHYNDLIKLHWIAGVDLLSGKTVWAPSETVFFDQPRPIHVTTTNGLASGNHIVEASLHALYEVIERDAGARLSLNGKIDLKTRGRPVRPESIESAHLTDLYNRLSVQGKVIICYVESVIGVSTFWAIILNPAAQSALTTLNIGWGTHRDSEVAMSRALTEAAQSRLTAIHGAREDVISKAGFQATAVHNSPAYRYFDQLQPTTNWKDLPNFSNAGLPDLYDDWQYLLDELREAGFNAVYRFELTRSDLNVPVVKIIVPGLGFNQRMF